MALVGKGAIRFIYKITFYCFCFLFHDYSFIMHIDNWFNICQAAITNLSLWATKPDHCVESVLVRSFFLVRMFFRIWAEYGDLQRKSPYSLKMWRKNSQKIKNNHFRRFDICLFQALLIIQFTLKFFKHFLNIITYN